MGEQDKARGGVGPLDDFERPVAFSLERGPEFVTGIAAIGEDVAQPGEAGPDRGQDIEGAVTVLDSAV